VAVMVPAVLVVLAWYLRWWCRWRWWCWRGFGRAKCVAALAVLAVLVDLSWFLQWL
jgi:hypothetical protein